jgi:myo-inositol-1-phosphate synthase
MNRIKVALVGVGNCASSLVQGLYFYAGRKSPAGLMHERLGGYGLADIEVVAAFDTDARKVGKDLAEAIFAKPNCTHVFHADVPQTGVTVRMGRVLDGMAPHMMDYGERGFIRADAAEADEDEIVRALKDSGAEILVNYLPVGSEEATRFYMECALKAGVAVVNCMPVFIASDPKWEKRFRDKGLPIVGDDIKAQLGATIVHRVLSSLFRARGVAMTRTYQLNTGGNTDFMNMLDRGRLASKKESKTEAVQSALVDRLEAEDIHIGPSDYIPFLNDNKLCFLRAEGNLFGEVPMNLELRLSVEDSPNSAAVVVDAIRCCKVALDRGVGGALTGPSAFFCKHPPQQFSDDVAAQLTEEFIAGDALAAE